MTRTEAIEKLALLAGTIVLETPVRSVNSVHSYVRRELILELEETLTALGYDMARARRVVAQITHEARGRERAEAEGRLLPCGCTTGGSACEEHRVRG